MRGENFSPIFSVSADSIAQDFCILFGDEDIEFLKK